MFFDGKVRQSRAVSAASGKRESSTQELLESSRQLRKLREEERRRIAAAIKIQIPIRRFLAILNLRKTLRNDFDADLAKVLKIKKLFESRGAKFFVPLDLLLRLVCEINFFYTSVADFERLTLLVPLVTESALCPNSALNCVESLCATDEGHDNNWCHALARFLQISLSSIVYTICCAFQVVLRNTPNQSVGAVTIDEDYVRSSRDLLHACVFNRITSSKLLTLRVENIQHLFQLVVPHIAAIFVGLEELHHIANYSYNRNQSRQVLKAGIRAAAKEDPSNPIPLETAPIIWFHATTVSVLRELQESMIQLILLPFSEPTGIELSIPDIENEHKTSQLLNFFLSQIPSKVTNFIIIYIRQIEYLCIDFKTKRVRCVFIMCMCVYVCTMYVFSRTHGCMVCHW